MKSISKSPHILLLLSTVFLLLVGCNGLDDYSESQSDGNLDETPPEAVSVIINENINVTSSVYSTLSLSAQDNVGITGYLVSEDETEVQNENANWQESAYQKSLEENIGIELSSAAGTKTVYAWFKDNEGNISESMSDSIELLPSFDDSVAPTNLTLIIDSGNASTSSRIVNIDLTGSDDQGIVAFYLSESSTDASPDIPGWVSATSATNYSDSAYFPLSADDGVKTVYSWVKDGAGNVSSPVNDTISLSTTSTDVTAPINEAIQINNGDSVTTSASITVDVSADDDTGVTAYSLSETDTIPDAGAAGWISVVSSLSYSGSQNFGLNTTLGVKNVYLWFKDAAGNISSSASDTIQLSTSDDFIAPQNPVMLIDSGNSTTSSRIVTIDVSGDDNQGIAAYYISESSLTPTSGVEGWISVLFTANYNDNIGFTLSDGDATKDVYLWFKDAAGNISIDTSDDIGLVTSSTDTSEPINAALLINSGAPITSTTAIIVDVTADDDVGVTAYYISETNSTPASNIAGWVSITSTTAYSDSIGIVLSSVEETKTIYAWFKDAAGNVSSGANDSIDYVIYDLQAPDGLSLTINAGDSSTDSLTVALEFNAQDDTGVIGYYLSEDGTTPEAGAGGWVTVDSSADYSGTDTFILSSGQGQKTVFLFVKDEANNISLTTSATILFEVNPYVSAGSYYTCAVLNEGSEKCWGRNNGGQVGDADFGNHMSPIAMNGIDTTTQLAAGSTHTCALLKSGTVSCWGTNNYGQLGRGYIDATPDVSADEIGSASLSSVVTVSAGIAHSCALIGDGRVKCWGRNNYGQLGYGATGGLVPTPIAVSGISNAIQMDNGMGESYHNCIVQSDGIIKCWGLGTNGQLGNSSTSSSDLPVSVDTSTDATHVSVGFRHSCAIFNGGRVRCWGRNNYGQLGDNTNTQRPTPVDVSGIDGSTANTSAVQITVSYYSSCALMEDQTLKCWGYGAQGQLGNSANSTSYIPVAVDRIDGVEYKAVQITSGIYHACALLEDGKIQCWGDGGYGQLGSGDNVDFNVPVTISF